MRTPALPNATTLAFLAWTVLFAPPLLGTPDLRTGVLVPLSALLWWPLVYLRPTRALALLALVLAGAANVVHIHYFGVLVDDSFMLTAARTNAGELREFASALSVDVLGWLLAWLAVATLASVLVLRHAPHWRALRSQPGGRRVLWLVLCAWVVLCGWAFSRESLSKRFVYRLRHAYPLQVVSAAVRQTEIAAALLYQPRLPTAPVAGPQVDTVVVVLGESASAARWSLLGYAQEDTNAPLRAIEGLQTARTMAHGFVTSTALPFLLTGMDMGASVEQAAPTFLDLAHSPQAGYKTFVFSNSRAFDTQEDFFLRALRRSADVYRKVGDGEHDGVLTPHLEAALADPAPRKLIVLHTYGSHTQLEQRYPARDYRLPDAYDNTIRYTSDLLAQWIALADQRSAAQTALLLYASDHGMILPPCASDYRHGLSVTSLEVPLLAWGNARLRQSLSELLPRFTEQDKVDARHSNALLARLALRATGFSDVAAAPAWTETDAPRYKGRPWGEVKRGDACTPQ
ncbi:sulfatase-like hydrolase/transferase [Pulveribacter suum]|nr:sulfatase-like hydrolase/transferase [Pulveribacter suum]